MMILSSVEERPIVLLLHACRWLPGPTQFDDLDSRKPDPTNPSADRFQYHQSESDPRWGWLGLACETT